MEATDRLDPHGPYIGRGEYGDVALYNSAGASIVIDGLVCGDGPATRRAVRAVRRYCGGPLRIRVTVTSGPSYHEHVDTCDVYGWRAALVAARAMRGECPEGRSVHVHACDARLQDLFDSE